MFRYTFTNGLVSELRVLYLTAVSVTVSSPVAGSPLITTEVMSGAVPVASPVGSVNVADPPVAAVPLVCAPALVTKAAAAPSVNRMQTPASSGTFLA